MSKDKHRSLTRRIALLSRGSIATNIEGGMSSQNPDLLRLERDGHMRRQRVVRNYAPGAYHAITVTTFVRTDSGTALLERHRDLLVTSDPYDGPYLPQHAHSLMRELTVAARLRRLKDRAIAAARTVESQMLISAALADMIEEDVIDSGWMPTETINEHPLMKMMMGVHRVAGTGTEPFVWAARGANLFVHGETEVRALQALAPRRVSGARRVYFLTTFQRPDGGAAMSYYHHETLDGRERIVLRSTHSGVPVMLAMQFR